MRRDLPHYTMHVKMPSQNYYDTNSKWLGNPDQTIRRLGQYYNNDSSKLALRGGDETLSEGLTAYASTK